MSLYLYTTPRETLTQPAPAPEPAKEKKDWLGSIANFISKTSEKITTIANATKPFIDLATGNQAMFGSIGLQIKRDEPIPVVAPQIAVKKDNTMMYVIIGGGVLLLFIILIIFIAKK